MNRPGIAGVLLAALALGSASCVTLRALFVPESEAVVPTVVPDPAYDELFPHYVEFCATSQYRSLAKGFGGIPGHAVMYLKGACRDPDAPYPLLRACDGEHGAGISVNRYFKNVNWIAVPGRSFFYDGDLRPRDRLTSAHRDATVERAIALGIFDGVELHEHPLPEGVEPGLESFVAHQSLATDFALRFARSLFCARLPITDEMLEEVIDFLNELNQEYATGAADYRWSGYSDNCVHTLHNALAAASVWEPKSINTIRTRQFFNMAVPANAFVDLAELGTSGPIDDFGKIWKSDPQRTALLQFRWLPTRHGAMLGMRAVHEPNDLFDTRFRLFVLDRPFGATATQRARRLLGDARFLELDANLRHFQRVYEGILRESEEQWDAFSTLRGDRYRLVRRRYLRYVEHQLAEVDAMLAALAGSGRGD